MRLLFSVSVSFVWVTIVNAQYSVYQPKNQVIFGGSSFNYTNTAAAAAASYTGAAAYDPTILNPPACSQPPDPHTGSSATHEHWWHTQSIDPSKWWLLWVLYRDVGVESSLGKEQVPFLNLMANLVERVGWVQVRVGGNSQENAELVESLPNGAMLAKDTNNTSNPTGTPPLAFTTDLLYLMANISSLTNTHWYLGIPFFNTTPFSLEIVENGQQILGDYLIGFQAGNEPDLYGARSHGHRPSVRSLYMSKLEVGTDKMCQTYSPVDYFGEVGTLIQQIANDPLIPKKDNLLIVPSVQTSWTPESVWDTGIVSSYSSSILSLAVERYPDDNCAAVYPSRGGVVQNPQDIFINYLQHNASTNMASYYTNSTAFAVQNGKPNFTGGAIPHRWTECVLQSVYPTTDQPILRSTNGPSGRSTTLLWSWSEVLGPHNTSQVVDLTSNINTPIYAVYENGAPTKIRLARQHIPPRSPSAAVPQGQSNATPSQVQVKYLLADSVSAKANFTWAGQTFGNNFGSDGRLVGDLNVTTVQCDTTANTCSVPVPAPGFALVFLTSDSLSAVSPASTVTYPTTVQSRTVNTIFIDPSMLATAYGHSGMGNIRGATSPGSSSASVPRATLPGASALLAAALGAVVVARRWL
ncbi:hypothetical protein EDB92DRAFT_1999798 [Lactarius akahatsu]|uniref:Beta-glucuronidase C-terminal domain-containing protein n=1 Tax=Lactarius akahatsu TaxID=416441 RepID=A0AAD4L4E0_9AGAM|nr:hypothetical protein EDB92DRAFT_1999798 [Lactarius akahatsu]